jgi:hypothetical protein
MLKIADFEYPGPLVAAVGLILERQLRYSDTDEPTAFEIENQDGPVVKVHIYRPVFYEPDGSVARPLRLPPDYVGEPTTAGGNLSEPAHAEMWFRELGENKSAIEVYAESHDDWMATQPIVNYILAWLRARIVRRTDTWLAVEP